MELSEQSSFRHKRIKLLLTKGVTRITVKNHFMLDKKTEKTKYFWLDGGHLYVYTIYMPTNICINIVAGLENEPEAVLIRAIQPVDGI